MTNDEMTAAILRQWPGSTVAAILSPPVALAGRIALVDTPEGRRSVTCIDGVLHGLPAPAPQKKPRKRRKKGDL